MEVIDAFRDEPLLDAGDSLVEYVQQLCECLKRWDPVSNTKGNEKREFVEALTEIAALPLDSISMEVRRLLVDGGDGDGGNEEDGLNSSPISSDSNIAPIVRIIAALSCRDVLLKCKAANALGSICISRVAGQRLLDVHGDAVLKSLMRMATCRNKWAQGDAFFVLGWVVVIADEAMLKQVARLVPAVIRFLHRSVAPEDANNGSRKDHRNHAAAPSSSSSSSTEEASNFRIYALVLLLNFVQRDVSVFASADTQQLLMNAMHAIVQKLNVQVIPTENGESGDANNCFEMSEFVELLRLSVTFTSLLVDQVDAVAPLVLEMKLLPALLKLHQVLMRVHEAGLLGGDEQEATDLNERMAAIVETVVACR